MKQLGALLLPPGWDASPLQGYAQQNVAGTHLYTRVKRDLDNVAKETTQWPMLGLPYHHSYRKYYIAVYKE